MSENGNDAQKSTIEKIEAAIQTIRPMLQNDGGDIELVSIDEDLTVNVRLQGACKGCPGAQMTLKMGVERVIRESVPEIKEVVAVN